MTSSDETELGPGAISSLAARVGKSFAGDASSGRGSVALVSGKFNGGVTQRLVQGALDALDAHGIDAGSVTITWVPGAFEIPLAAQRMARSAGVRAVIALGAVIKGETAHFDFVAGQCAQGCQRVALSTGVPVIFGVLTTDDVQQALDRSRPDKQNKGYEAAVTALEMMDLLVRLPERPSEGG